MARTHGIDKPKPDRAERQRQRLQEELASVERLLVVWNSKAIAVRAALEQLANPLAKDSQDSQKIAKPCQEVEQSQASAEAGERREAKTGPLISKPKPSGRRRGRPTKSSASTPSPLQDTPSPSTSAPTS